MCANLRTRQSTHQRGRKYFIRFPLSKFIDHHAYNVFSSYIYVIWQTCSGYCQISPRGTLIALGLSEITGVGAKSIVPTPHQWRPPCGSDHTTLSTQHTSLQHGGECSSNYTACPPKHEWNTSGAQTSPC